MYCRLFKFGFNQEVFMAHARKDTLTKSGEWAKHLRLWGKKMVAHAERQAVKKEIIGIKLVEPSLS
jgi:hypothetical protein